MKRLRLLLATLLAIVGATNVSAQEVYAVYTSDNTTLTFYYDNQRSSRTGDTYDLNTSGTIPVWYSNGTCSSVTKVVFNSSFSSARPTTTFRWFCGMSNLTTISGLMLLNTTQVTDMQYMFKDCSSLTTLDLSSFNTDKVTNMYAMFNNCSSLTSLDLSSFNTKKVANMYAMFYNCRNLTSLDLSSFNTANVTDMGNMFGSCLSLTSLNLGSFNTNKVTNMHSMFLWCTSLNTVYVGSGWSTENVTESNSKRMFETCNALVGDKGTTFDANHIDKAYARIDGGNSSPGYFTDINTPKAYARLTDTKLTFYFGLNWSMRTGSLYYLNEGYNDPDWQSNNTPALITSV